MAKRTGTENMAAAAVDAPVVMMVDVDSIKIGKNHRHSDSDMAALADSIRSAGRLLQPVGVSADNTLVFGHRRLAAVRMLGWKQIPAVRLPEGADEATLRAMENLQRRDLDPIEEAIAVADMMLVAEAEVHARLGMREQHIQAASPVALDAYRREATAKVAERLGKTEAWVRDRNFLGTLDKTTRLLVVEGKLPWQHARELVKIADPDKRAELAKAAAIGGKQGWRGPREAPMLLSELRDEVAKHIRSLAQVPWRLDVPFAGAPSCEACPSNSKNQSGLFDGKVRIGRTTTGKEPDAGVCLNAACYGRKSGAASRAISTACKRVTVTVNQAPAKEREKAAPEAIKQHAPVIVKPATWTREAKDHRERYSAAAKNKPSKAAAEAKPRAETAEAKAKREYDDAESEWGIDVERQIEKHLKSAGLPGVLMQYVSESEIVDKAGRNKGPDQRTRDQVLALIRAAAAGNAAEVTKVKSSMYIELYDLRAAGFIADVAEALGIKIKQPRPKLEDFLPKASAAKPAGAKKGKAKAAAASDDVDDGEEDDQ